MFVGANNSFDMSVPVSFLSFGSSKLQFETWTDQTGLKVYLLVDDSTLAVHKVDFDSYNSTKISLQAMLGVNCFSIQAT